MKLESVRQERGLADSASTVDHEQLGLSALGFLIQLSEFAGAIDELNRWRSSMIFVRCHIYSMVGNLLDVWER